MLSRLLLSAAIAALVCARASAKKHDPDPIVQGCITISDIRWHHERADVRLARGTPTIPGSAPGLGATVTSQCPVAAKVRLTITYFDKHGAQLGTVFERTELPPGGRSFFHQEAWLLLTGKCDACDPKSFRLHSGTITNVEVWLEGKTETNQ
jgi:hypothetical protein